MCSVCIKIIMAGPASASAAAMAIGDGNPFTPATSVQPGRRGMSDAPMGRGSVHRGGSVRRKLSPAFGPGSPKAKKPAMYVQPMPAEIPVAGYKMTIDQVANQAMQNRDAIMALHQWVNTVADAAWEHAGMIDKLGDEIVLTKGKLSTQEEKIKKQHDGAEFLISKSLVELKGIVDTLRAETTTTTAQLSARAEQLE